MANINLGKVMPEHNLYLTKSSKEIREKLKNCKNCGAPLRYEGDYCKCRYCDTEY